MRFYLDEDLPYRIAIAARERGVDIMSSYEDGRNGLSDERQLMLAAQDNRCFVGRNYRHLVPLTEEFLRDGLPHAGLLLVPRSLAGQNFAAIAAALVHFDREHPWGLGPYTVLWLRPPPVED